MALMSPLFLNLLSTKQKSGEKSDKYIPPFPDPKSPVLFPYPAPPVLPLPALLSFAPEYGAVSAWEPKRNSSVVVGAEEGSDLFPFHTTISSDLEEMLG